MKMLKGMKRNLNYVVLGAIMVTFIILSLVGVLKTSTVYLLEEMAIKIILKLSLSLDRKSVV